MVLPLYGFKVANINGYTDFDVFYRAADRWWQGLWDALYNPQLDGASPYRYAPPWTLFFLPFLALQLTQARVVWYLIQFGFYLAGFWVLRRTLQRSLSEDRSAVSLERIDALIAASALLSLRYFLDSFTIGQVTGLMFFCTAWSIEKISKLEFSRASLGLAIPTLLKIGPGVLYGLGLSRYPRPEREARPWARLWSGLVIWFVVAYLLPIPFLMVHTQSVGDAVVLNHRLWLGWLKTVSADSHYTDLSHYGSQSLKSGIARLTRLLPEWISRDTIESLWKTVVFLGVSALAWIWIRMEVRSLRSLLLSLGLGSLAYLLLMPETFKYSMPYLVFPLLGWMMGFLPSERAWTRVDRILLLSMILSLTLGGLDLMGPTLYFASQRASVPLVVLVVFTFRIAYLLRSATVEVQGETLGRMSTALLVVTLCSPISH